MKKSLNLLTCFIFNLALSINVANASIGNPLCPDLLRMKRPFAVFVQDGRISSGSINIGSVPAQWKNVEQAYHVQTGVTLITSGKRIELSELGNTSAFAEYKEIKSICPNSRTFDVNVWIAKRHEGETPFVLDLELPAIRAFGKDGLEVPLTPADGHIAGLVTSFESNR